MIQPAVCLDFDLVIIGGGVAGLWLLNRLRKHGYNAVLFEQGDLGEGQTIASQGMIHGGVKYTLSGALSGASEAIAEMPDYWRRCLAGEGEVDLSHTNVLSDHFYMWSTAGSLSKVTAFFASKALRGRVEKLSAEQYPEVFQHPDFRGQVYKLVDKVIDTASLLKNLAGNMPDRIFRIDWQQCALVKAENQIHLVLDKDIRINAQQFIFAAGKGNQSLLETVGAEQPVMQLRPLQQVMVKHNNALPLYAHCIGSESTPRLTISTHSCVDGKTCWYLGGQLAEKGVEKNARELISDAKQELQALFPWLDWQQSVWQTLTIERAEPRQKNLSRPDQAFIARVCHKSGEVMENLSVAWPTKLTLVPNLGETALQLLGELNIQPIYQSGTGVLQEKLEHPDIAKAPWDKTAEQEWLL